MQLHGGNLRPEGYCDLLDSYTLILKYILPLNTLCKKKILTYFTKHINDTVDNKKSLRHAHLK